MVINDVSFRSSSSCWNFWSFSLIPLNEASLDCSLQVFMTLQILYLLKFRPKPINCPLREFVIIYDNEIIYGNLIIYFTEVRNTCENNSGPHHLADIFALFLILLYRFRWAQNIFLTKNSYQSVFYPPRRLLHAFSSNLITAHQFYVKLQFEFVFE